MIYRGSTVTNYFTSDIDLSEVTNLYVTFAQDHKVIFEKTLDDVEFKDEGKVVAVPLTQEDTIIFKNGLPVEIQIVATLHNSKLVSNILRTDVGKLLRDGEF